MHFVVVVVVVVACRSSLACMCFLVLLSPNKFIMMNDSSLSLHGHFLRYSLTTEKTGRKLGWITLKIGSHPNLPVNSFRIKGSLKSIVGEKKTSEQYLKKSPTLSPQMS